MSGLPSRMRNASKPHSTTAAKSRVLQRCRARDNLALNDELRSVSDGQVLSPRLAALFGPAIRPMSFVRRPFHELLLRSVRM